MARLRHILIEALLVTLAGMAFALVANALSPRGLLLTRNYFPGDTTAPHARTPAPVLTNGIGDGSEFTETAARLRSKGLQAIAHEQVAAWFEDPRRAQELIVFIDARDDRHYREGHIPGAYQLDHYRAEQYLATVLPVVQSAEQIVVYCNGGRCDDSESAALLLHEAGVPLERFFIYPGGFTEWRARALPIEVGDRGSSINTSDGR